VRNSEFFAKRLETELPAFSKVLRAVPADKLDYRPHERNSTAGGLAAQMAMEMDSLTGLFPGGTIDYKPGNAPKTIDAIAEVFERSAKRVIESVRGTSDEQWVGPAKFIYDGNVAWESTVDDMAWGFLFDLIHHRGQLSAYLRPMGAKVPAIYGPSADDPGGA